MLSERTDVFHSLLLAGRERTRTFKLTNEKFEKKKKEEASDLLVNQRQ